MHVAIGILQCIDINEFTIDREKDKMHDDRWNYYSCKW